MAQVLCHLPKFSDPNLIVGFENSDDAAVYRINDDTVMIQTVDIFPPVVDDPYIYGQIAATNSLSDVYAMGGEPRLCMNIMCLPEDLPKEDVKGILEGGYNKVLEANAIIAGGHTLKDKEPKYGLCVTGFTSPENILANDGLRQGDLLILTKPLGSGVLNTANKAQLLSQDEQSELMQYMCALNKYPYEIMRKFSVNACTDVTGFGLLGHAHEIATASKLSIKIFAESVPLMSGAGEMAKMGIIPAGAYANRDFLNDKVSVSKDVPLFVSDLLFDPQTSGGLLISASESEAQKLVRALKDSMQGVEIVGQVLSAEDKSVIVE